MELAPGIGPATVNIFLRELRGVWVKAAPPLSPLAQAAAAESGLAPRGLSPREALEEIGRHWQAQALPGHDFADLEAALVRLGLELRRERRKKVEAGGKGRVRGVWNVL